MGEGGGGGGNANSIPEGRKDRRSHCLDRLLRKKREGEQGNHFRITSKISFLAEGRKGGGGGRKAEVADAKKGKRGLFIYNS